MRAEANLYNMMIVAEIDGRVREIDTSTIDDCVLRIALGDALAELVHQGKLKSDDICCD